MQTPLRIDPARALADIATFQHKLAAGMGNLRSMREPEYANTPRELVYSEDKLKVWHFTGHGKPTAKTPLLIVYALVNTVWMTDLQTDRSMVRNLLEQGEDVYLIDWGYPDGADRWLTLDDYINGYLDRCVDAVRARHDLDAISLLGICQGGAFSLCYTALHPDKVKNLITMVTPVDFHTPDNMLSHWCRRMDVDLFVDTMGNIPAGLMNYVYLTLKPLRLTQQKYIDMVDILDKPAELENFLRMERWIFDSPDQAGEAFRQFIKDFYQGNKLVEGTLQIGGQNVDLGMITQPVLNIFAEQDHLVPPDAARALGKYVGTTDYTQLAFKGGHIGIYVSSRAQREVPPAIHQWLHQRD
ncbi:class III poly(R)-hydroxyalkanoic acid synthase subunit PhaC [Rhodanobacter thiooxydans]|uniref:Poly(3-hydroxyalkanoate) polymerase subunit PhaC n=1 Tax=Rhodanobacter thiooxydans TaxID=416169 RepID=A0A154QI86_9GAMM|nr:class III poly(R)-hydroxyalkanoic acid synthase subunit PhaC [Rhodanobacter thiooxydans]EIL99931.1 poly(R)-hydroxyalkanoic acid synthase, class III, PhaC subunit [Rhodanobacter thiooxydans LCS2]KZC23562.1 class III poly(R)-hydroxyalkanoic acid synthase subunit PhaC [Rhodanobacter thiooxydans]MCW0203637.1 class III poly(R)-hydroxyalkanoic acid synthase subunit PhaC [Rhodanobacter thiooxydans]